MSAAAKPPSLLPLPFGYRHLALGVIGSTNDEAQRFAVQGEPAGLIVSASEQTQGRGRQRRSWLSPAGGLYCSFLLRPPCELRQAPEVGFVTAVAVADAVIALLGTDERVGCKWPNDILVGGRKVAGILVESAALANNTLDWVVAGIGINLGKRPAADMVMYPATCLADEGATAVSPEMALAVLAAAMATWLERWQTVGFAPVRQAWLRRAHRQGERLVVRGGAADLEGEFIDLDANGALVLQTQQGRRVVTAGDCFPENFPAD